jgi:predicted O-methyltransferase YrrM
MNSLGLSRFEERKYDLIWVDGDHTFPVVACDLANAVRLLEAGGVMMCDDIYLSDGRKSKWGSQEALKVLNAFERAKIVTASYVLKSLRPEKNYSARVKKYLAIVKLVP